jgi:hypothetical protein
MECQIRRKIIHEILLFKWRIKTKFTTMKDFMLLQQATLKMGFFIDGEFEVLQPRKSIM